MQHKDREVSGIRGTEDTNKTKYDMLIVCLFGRIIGGG